MAFWKKLNPFAWLQRIYRFEEVNQKLDQSHLHWFERDIFKILELFLMNVINSRERMMIFFLVYVVILLIMTAIAIYLK